MAHEASPDDGVRLGLQSWNDSQIQVVASIASALASTSQSLSGGYGLIDSVVGCGFVVGVAWAVTLTGGG